MARCFQIRWTEKHWCSEQAFCLASLPDHIKPAQRLHKTACKFRAGYLNKKESIWSILCPCQMQTAIHYSTEVWSKCSQDSYIYHKCKTIQTSISYQHVCVHTFYRMQAYIPLTEKSDFLIIKSKIMQKTSQTWGGVCVHTNIFKKIQNSNTTHVNYCVHKYHRLWIYSVEILHVPYKIF